MNLNDKLLVAFGTIGIFCSAIVIGVFIVALVISYAFTGKVSDDLITGAIAIVGANLLFAAAIMFGARNSGRR
jgi:hypothetical protein